MEDEQAAARVSPHLKIGVGAIGVAVGYVVGTLQWGDGVYDWQQG